MPGNEIQRWVDARRAAESRELAELASSPPDPVDCFEQALALTALVARLHGWPLPEDDVRRRNDEVARKHWGRLRTAMTGK